MNESHAAMRDDAFPLSSENWAQVQDLLAEALERFPGARTAFLRQACGGDLALYREVESLLVAYDEAGSFLDSFDTAGAAALLAVKADAAAGTTVGPYRIVCPLGRGGMGVVYLAEDTRLDRRVALKFLPPNLAANDVARRRLLDEAKAAAALDHPHIGVVHEINETEDGRPFIAMAYYEGETLREKISRGPLPLAETIRLARQIADGLRAAHRQGIIHRDVKPSNIVITAPRSEPAEKGVAKIIDFGIAWLMDAELTEAEMAPGTVAYISPEQAQGKAVDHRRDIWSLGVVLYEMLTGQRPFRGASHEAVMHSILYENPVPISSLRSEVPPALEAVVHECLVKDPQARCRSMAEVIRHLENPSTAGDRGTAANELAWSTPRSVKYYTGLLGVLVLAVIGTAIFRYILPSALPPPKEPAQSVRFTSYTGQESMPAFSPDGNQIVFQWNGEDQDNQDIYLKHVGTGVYDPVRLTEHPGADYAPAWSPDGLHIAFVRQTANEIGIYRMPAQGGGAQRLTSLLLPSPLSWSPDGTILFFVDRDSLQPRSAVYALSIATLKRQKLTDPPAGVEDLYARISPDGTTLAFAMGRRMVRGLENIHGDVTNMFTDLYVVSLPGGTPRRLTFDGSTINGLAWTPDSREIVYSSDRVSGYGNLRLWRIPTGGGASEPISTRGDRDIFPAISPDGKRLAYVEGRVHRTSFWRYELPDADGQSAPPRRLIHSSAKEISAEYSPDGSRIVFASQRTGSDEIWVCDRDGRNPVQLTFFGGPRTGTPRWSPDGRLIAFDSWLEGGPRAHIYVVPADGGKPRRVTPDSMHGGAPSWSRDGQWIYGGNADGDLWKIQVDGGRAARVPLKGRMPMESPDGKWIYYWKEIDIPWGAIWRKPVAGGEESLVIDTFRVNPWGTWVAFNDGMYFLDGNQQQGYGIKFFDFTTRKAATVMKLPAYSSYMHVSPDREHLLVRRREGGEVDLVLLENWR